MRTRSPAWSDRLHSLLLLASLALAGGLASCHWLESRPRVLIVGIDGASPRVVDALFKDGKLPNLRAIADRGVYGHLRSELPLLSPRVWTTVATGKRPQKHGILGWVTVGNDARADLYYGTDRKVHALWNIVSDAGKSVAVVNWLVTYPPEVVNGIIVTDHLLPAAIGGKEYIGEAFAQMAGAHLNPVLNPETGASAVYPQEWTARALDSRHERAVLTGVENPFGEGARIGFDASLKDLRRYWTTDERLTSLMLEILEEKSPDVAMILLQGIDQMSHSLFGCLDDPSTYPPTFRITPEERSRCQDAVYRYYEFTDQLIGRLLQHFGRNDLVLVISDHGFEGEFHGALTGNHQSRAAADGVFLVRGRGVRAGAPERPFGVADVTPTVLAWLGMPPAEDMDGKPAPFLQREDPPLAPIPTYDGTPIERAGAGRSGAEAGMKEKLRSLGYVE